MSHTALIVDDESHARTTLKHFLKLHVPELKVIGEACSVQEAKSLIASEHPKLVFLDIDLGAESGFDLLDHYQSFDFSVIFVTGYSSFAVKAFRYAALDYLVKPLVPENLVQAVARLSNGSTNPQGGERISTLRHSMQSKELKIITLSTLEAFIPVEIEQITLCKSSGNYTDIHLVNGQKETVCKPIREFEELLPATLFVRVHQSYIINLKFLDRYAKRDSLIIMKDSTEITLARRRKEQFLQVLQQGRR